MSYFRVAPCLFHNIDMRHAQLLPNIASFSQDFISLYSALSMSQVYVCSTDLHGI